MARLVVEKGKDKGKSVAIPGRGPITVGREAGCALVLDDTMVSRSHFRIEQRDDAYLVVDLESMNGTIVNGTGCKTAKARAGDIIKIGMTVISIAADEGKPDPWLGRTIMGKYEILERIGRGGMGTCYRAIQKDLDRVVALKAISPEYSGRKDFVDLFIHEARFAAKLNHPNVVQIYEVGQEGGVYFYAMEFVPGGTVADRLTALPDHRLGPKETIDIALQVAHALEYAHAKGIMHRDIKPENMMLGERGIVKLVDLGLAQSLGEKVAMAENSYVLGTPHFIAPEIILNKPFDFRSDIYSLGVSVYQMLTGSLPFDDPNMKELTRLKLYTEPPPMDRLAVGLPRSMVSATMNMLKRDPEQRYATITDVIVDLERVKKELVGDKRLSMTTALSAGGVAVAAIAALVFVLWPNPAPVTPPPSPVDETPALTMFLNADTYELKVMDRRRVDSIQEAISRYDEVIKRYPKSESARKAKERKSALEQRIAELRSQEEYAAVVAEEDPIHRAFLASIGMRRPDPTIYQEIVGGYKAVAARYPGTPAGKLASAKAELIERWLSMILELRGYFESTQDKVENHLGLRKYAEALQFWDEFLERASEKRSLFAGSKDARYRDVHYDREARKERDKATSTIQQTAQVRLSRIDEQIRNELFDRALEDLRELQNDMGMIASVRLLIDDKARDIERKRAEHLAAIKRQEEAKHRLDLAADAQQFQSICRDIYESYSCRYQFTQAKATVLDRRRDLLKTPEYKARLDARERQLARADLFFKSFTNVVSDAQNQYNIRRDFDYPGFTAKGKMTAASSEGLTIEISPGTTRLVRMDQIRPQLFARIVRTSWKITDLSTMMNFVSFLMETGVFDAARTHLKELTTFPRFADTKEATDFHAAMLRALDLDEPLEDLEVEAQKRIAALSALNEIGELEEALDLILQLQSRLKDTQYYRTNHKTVETQLQDIKRKLQKRKP